MATKTSEWKPYWTKTKEGMQHGKGVIPFTQFKSGVCQAFLNGDCEHYEHPEDCKFLHRRTKCEYGDNCINQKCRKWHSEDES